MEKKKKKLLMNENCRENGNLDKPSETLLLEISGYMTSYRCLNRSKSIKTLL